MKEPLPSPHPERLTPGQEGEGTQNFRVELNLPHDAASVFSLLAMRIPP